MTAGFHRIDITPPIGAPLAGFAARQGLSTGVHDPLFVRALAIEQHGHAAVFVSVDVLGLTAEFVHDVREAVAARTRLDADAVMISATHTHSAPVTVSTFFNPGEALDPAYMERLAAAIVDAVEVAWRERSPARVGVGSGRASGIGSNRRTADRMPVDDEVGILKVAHADGRPRGVLITHACHPTVLGPDNLLVTGDFPAFAIDRIEAQLGAGSFALFVNGTQGNISMGHSSELSAIGVITPGRTFARAVELGHRLAGAVLDALPSIATAGDVAIDRASRIIDLPFNAYPPPAETAAALAEAEAALATLERSGAAMEEIGPARTRRLYASIRNFYASEAAARPGGRLPVEIQGFRLGSAHFVAIPAEVFVEIGLRIKREIDHPVFVVGITNGYIGYLPNRDAYWSGGYEVVSAKVTEAAEDLLVGAVHDLDRRLFAEVPYRA